MKSKADVYSSITNRVIEQLEQGTRPWVKPWSVSKDNRNILLPLRATSEAYRGINVLLFWDAAIEKGYTRNIWMTFKQSEAYKAHVKKGEKGTTVVYADRASKTETDAQGEEVESRYSFLKSYTVFNVEQVEGLPERFYEPPAPQDDEHKLTLIEEAEAFFAKTGAVIHHGGNRAFYAPGPDFIQMPNLQAFTDAESYTATKAHELVHWTGHKDRENREFGKRFGDQAYAFEELVAELGAAFLCCELGIYPEPREDHAAYLASWLKVLKSDKRAIFTAAGLAQKALDHLMGFQGSQAEGEEELAA
jgi:antirestriction protein ArdC